MSEGEVQGTDLSIQSPGGAPKAEAQVEEAAMPATGSVEVEHQKQYAGKFNSPEDLEKSYLELQKKMGERPDNSQLGLDALMQQAGVSGEEIGTNWVNDGKLTDEQYQKLAGVGFNREIVDQFLRGQAAISQNTGYEVQQAKSRASTIAGGEEQLENLFNWAGQNLPADRVDSLNQRLADPRQYESAVKELMFDWKQASGSGMTQELVQGTPMPNTMSGFATVDEYVKAAAEARQNGFNAAYLKRLSNTPEHIIRGVDR